MKKKKVCMVGDFAVGKTSLTQKFVNNVFSEKYLTTVGVKIDTAELGDDKLVVWDIAGRDTLSPLNANYLVGCSGYVLVADGTRSHTLHSLESLKATVEERVGEIPFVVALNKVDDLAWSLSDEKIQAYKKNDWQMFMTSAKTGENVAELFQELANLMK